MRLAKFGALAITTVLVVGACSSTGSASGGGGKTIKIGTELPMSGGETANGEPTANGVKLAVQQIQRRGRRRRLDHSTSTSRTTRSTASTTPQQGAKNMQTLVADPTVVGVVGPFNSSVAQAEIPISNEAGLLQCSPANTNTGLTYPPDARQYRPTQPDKIAYIRPPPRTASRARPAPTTSTTTSAPTVGLHPRRHRDLRRRRRRHLPGRVQEGRRHRRQARQRPQVHHRLHPALHRGRGAEAAAVYLAGTTPTGMGLALKQGRTVAGLRDDPLHGSGRRGRPRRRRHQQARRSPSPARPPNVYGTVAGVHDIPDAAKFTDRLQGRVRARIPAPTAPSPTPARR